MSHTEVPDALAFVVGSPDAVALLDEDVARAVLELGVRLPVVDDSRHGRAVGHFVEALLPDFVIVSPQNFHQRV